MKKKPSFSFESSRRLIFHLKEEEEALFLSETSKGGLGVFFFQMKKPSFGLESRRRLLVHVKEEEEALFLADTSKGGGAGLLLLSNEEAFFWI